MNSYWRIHRSTIEIMGLFKVICYFPHGIFRHFWESKGNVVCFLEHLKQIQDNNMGSLDYQYATLETFDLYSEK